MFLRERHVSNCTATVAHKLDWLLLVIGENSIHYSTLMYYITGLEEFGPQRPSERRRHAAIVRAFGLELRNNKNLLPPSPPARAMEPEIFSKLMMELGRPRCLRSHEFRQACLRTALKVMWTTGLRPMELRYLQPGWLTRYPAGYVLRCHGKWARQNRTLVMPRYTDKLLCPVRELDEWLKRVPTNAHSFVFPHTDGFHRVQWRKPIMAQALQDRFKAVIDRIGLSGRYTLKSIRLSFLKRARNKHGDTITFLLSGLSQPHVLYHCLRQEPDWSRIKTLLDGQ